MINPMKCLASVLTLILFLPLIVVAESHMDLNILRKGTIEYDFSAGYFNDNWRGDIFKGGSYSYEEEINSVSVLLPTIGILINDHIMVGANIRYNFSSNKTTWEEPVESKSTSTLYHISPIFKYYGSELAGGYPYAKLEAGYSREKRFQDTNGLYQDTERTTTTQILGIELGCGYIYPLNNDLFLDLRLVTNLSTFQNDIESSSYPSTDEKFYLKNGGLGFHIGFTQFYNRAGFTADGRSPVLAISKGTIDIGGTFSYTLQGSSSKKIYDFTGKIFTTRLQIDPGYFINRFINLGLIIDFTRTEHHESDDNSSFFLSSRTIEFGPRISVYFSKLGVGYPFISLGVLYAEHLNVARETYDLREIHDSRFGKIGYALPLSQSLALEPHFMFEDHGYSYGLDVSEGTRFTIGIGLRKFLQR